MPSPKTLVNVGTTLIVLFLVTAVTGIVLHLKKHGIIIEPRPVIKIIHWVAGLLMALFACIHARHFWRMLTGMRSRLLWFWLDSWAVIILLLATFATGFVKLLSPARIPHLGLWHYALGIAMTVVILIHLVRGLPSWHRLSKIRKK